MKTILFLVVSTGILYAAATSPHPWLVTPALLAVMSAACAALAIAQQTRF